MSLASGLFLGPAVGAGLAVLLRLRTPGSIDRWRNGCLTSWLLVGVLFLTSFRQVLRRGNWAVFPFLLVCLLVPLAASDLSAAAVRRIWSDRS